MDPRCPARKGELCPCGCGLTSRTHGTRSCYKAGCRGDACTAANREYSRGLAQRAGKAEGRQRNELETLTGTILHRQAPTPASPAPWSAPAATTVQRRAPARRTSPAKTASRRLAITELAPPSNCPRCGACIDLGCPGACACGAGTPRNGGAPPLAPGATPLVDGWGGPVAGMILPPPGAPDPCQQPQPIRSCGSCGEVARYELAHAAASGFLCPRCARTAVTLLPGARLHDLAPGGQKQLASWSGSVTGIILPPPGAPIQPQASPAPTAPALAQPSLGEVVHGALRAWPKPAGRTLAGPGPAGDHLGEQADEEDRPAPRTIQAEPVPASAGQDAYYYARQNSASAAGDLSFRHEQPAA